MGSSYPLFLPNMTKTVANFHNNLTDPDIRLKESREALFEIVKKGYFNEIIIVDGSENPVLSDAEISSFAAKGITIEQLLFKQNKDLVEQFGKGHGEMQITNYMVENSELVKKAGGFVKLTPRYYFDNIEQVLPVINQFDNVFFYYYPEPVRKIKPFLVSIFYKTSLDFYNKHLKSSIEEHSKEVSGFMESVMYRRVNMLNKKGIATSFPHFSGTQGTTGRSIRNQYYFLRNLSAKLGLMVYHFEI